MQFASVRNGTRAPSLVSLRSGSVSQAEWFPIWWPRLHRRGDELSEAGAFQCARRSPNTVGAFRIRVKPTLSVESDSIQKGHDPHLLACLAIDEFDAVRQVAFAEVAQGGQKFGTKIWRHSIDLAEMRATFNTDMAPNSLPSRVCINDEHLISQIVWVQRSRRYKTTARCMERLLLERLAQLDLDPLASPPTTKSQGRAGAVNSSRCKGGRTCLKSA